LLPAISLATKLLFGAYSGNESGNAMGRMGRPPIGKRAMTSTERSRRRRAGLAAERAAAKSPEPATTEPESDAKDQMIALFAGLAGLHNLIEIASKADHPDRLKACIALVDRGFDPTMWSIIHKATAAAEQLQRLFKSPADFPVAVPNMAIWRELDRTLQALRRAGIAARAEVTRDQAPAAAPKSSALP
jgi:hypothetical protein